ncbi:MAG: cell division protein FtsQ/DivIB [Schaalia turicensis]
MRSARVTLARPVGQQDAAALLGGEKRNERSEFDLRRQERARARRILCIKMMAMIAAGLAFIGGLVWVLLFSPLLALSASSVHVEGADETLITAESVLSSTAPYVGTPLPRVPTAAIAESIESNVVVASAEVERQWPTGLAITITLRTPAMIEGSAGAFRQVDDEGVSFADAPTLIEGLPLVSLPETDEERAEAASDVLSLWSNLSEATKAQVSGVSADGKTLSFTLTNGAQVKWGTPDDGALKAQVLDVLLAQRSVRVYDVSSPTHPVTS